MEHEDGAEQGSVVTARQQWLKRELARRLRQELTPAESRVWRQLRGSRLAGLHFRRQQVIAGFIADFYCHAARLVVEVDGAVHDGQTEYDAERARIFATLGLHTLRVTNAQVAADLYAVSRAIRVAACQRRAAVGDASAGDASAGDASPPAR